MSFDPRVLFIFSTEHLAKKDKVRFFYAFKGRGDKEGLVSRVAGEHLGPGVLLVSDAHSSEVESFLQYWKCESRMLSLSVENALAGENVAKKAAKTARRKV